MKLRTHALSLLPCFSATRARCATPTLTLLIRAHALPTCIHNLDQFRCAKHFLYSRALFFFYSKNTIRNSYLQYRREQELGKAGSNGRWKLLELLLERLFYSNPDEQYYSLMRQISRNQIFMLRSHPMNNYYTRDNLY